MLLRFRPVLEGLSRSERRQMDGMGQQPAPRLRDQSFNHGAFHSVAATHHVVSEECTPAPTPLRASPARYTARTPPIPQEEQRCCNNVVAEETSAAAALWTSRAFRAKSLEKSELRREAPSLESPELKLIQAQQLQIELLTKEVQRLSLALHRVTGSESLLLALRDGTIVQGHAESVNTLAKSGLQSSAAYTHSQGSCSTLQFPVVGEQDSHTTAESSPFGACVRIDRDAEGNCALDPAPSSEGGSVQPPLRSAHTDSLSLRETEVSCVLVYDF